MFSSTQVVAALVPGGWELLLVFFIILLLFGSTKLPGLAKGLGQSIKEFKKASRDDDETKPGTTAEVKKIESSETQTKTK